MLEQADEAAHAGAVYGGSACRHQEEDAFRDSAQGRPAAADRRNEHERQDAGQGVVTGPVGEGARQELSAVRQGLRSAQARASQSHCGASAQP